MSVVAILEVTADPQRLEYNLQQEALEEVVPVISRCDLPVLEWGKRLAKARGTELILIVVGCDGDEALLSAISLVGVTRVVMVCSPYSAVEQPKQRVVQLASLIHAYAPEIVLCSEQQSDGFHSFTGGWLAEILQISHIGGVEQVETEAHLPHLLVKTEYGKGYKATFQVTLPTVLSVLPKDTVSYIPRFSRVHLLSRCVPLEKVKFAPIEDTVRNGGEKAIVFDRLSEVKPRTKGHVPATATAGRGKMESGPTRANPLAARMNMMLGGARAEKSEAKTKQVITDSADLAAQLLLQKLEEWRKER